MSKIERNIIVYGNDCEMLIEMKVYDKETGQFIDFDLSQATNLIVFLICSKHATEIDLPFDIEGEHNNIIHCVIDHRLLHQNASYGVVVEGYNTEQKHFRFELLPSEGFLVVSNTSGVNLTDSVTTVMVTGKCGWGIQNKVVEFDSLTPEQKEELKGDKGDKGDTGEQGPQGETGATGPQGPAGKDGKGVDHDYSKDYLTFEALESGTFSFTRSTLEYSIDNGQTWTSLPPATASPTISEGSIIMWRCSSPTIKTSGIDGGMGVFSSTGKYKAYGNIMSLNYGDDFTGRKALPNWIFRNLFKNNTGLIDAYNVVLKAINVTYNAYASMFEACSNLEKAPKEIDVPNASGNDCCSGMFSGCTKLTEVPATVSGTWGMAAFAYYVNGCSSLNKLKCLYEGNATNGTYQWVVGVAATGVFIKSDNKNWPIGASGIPTGWVAYTEAEYELVHQYQLNSKQDTLVSGTNIKTINNQSILGSGNLTISAGDGPTGPTGPQGATGPTGPQGPMPTSYVASLNGMTGDVTYTAPVTSVNGMTGDVVIQSGETDYSKQYLTFEALEDNTTFSFTTNDLQYSLDGTTWSTLTAGSTSPAINTGETIMWKQTGLTPTSNDGIGTFSSTDDFNVYGNIMSLIYGDNFENQKKLSGKNYAFSELFKNCTNLISCQNLILPATILSGYCYAYMFQSCTHLTTAPELPATTLVDSCYFNMFYGCASLTTAPELPATTLARGCYGQMFDGCTNLTTAPELPATTLAYYCYGNMFGGCTSLTTAPSLPATTLVYHCYYGMFVSCTSLTTAPELPATTLANSCYGSMFSGCTSLIKAPYILPALTASDECYRHMFNGCTSLIKGPIIAATTIGVQSYQEMFQNCTNLTEAPELPATTLGDWCYADMFANCSSLKIAPELPATTIGMDAYWEMFMNCSSLEFVKCLATNTGYPNTYNFLPTNPSGIIVIGDNATWESGSNGTNGWIVYTESEWKLVHHYELANTVTSTATGLKIEVVASIPTAPDANTIYIVQ